MHTQAIHHWRHDHVFGQDRARQAERRTLVVVAITAAMMVVEIVAGLAFGSMALLADGLHMASHAGALGLAVVAHGFARRYARDDRFNFGTGKVNALAGFTSAILLAGFAVLMAWESFERFLFPVDIAFDWAITVAVAGLVVNAACARILHRESHHDHEDPHLHEDHNLRAAYLHVLADAVTSLLAIVALLSGKLFGLNWMDPLMGVLGAILVMRWSVRLVIDTAWVLLDQQAPREVRDSITGAIEGADDNRIADLHAWSIGPRTYAAAISLVTVDPRPPEYYRGLIPRHAGVVHATIEVHRCRQHL